MEQEAIPAAEPALADGCPTATTTTSSDAVADLEPRAHSSDGGDGGDKVVVGPRFFSVAAHFDERCSVLLTGASGYIGSLVLEKLLRTTRVGHVYLLLRPRRGVGPAERVAKLLRGPLFHLLSEADVAGRVTAVAGDINEPGLGLSEEDAATLVERVDTVVHSAADIRLDAPIHATLRANYLGALAAVALAARMPRLRSLVYVSTCYVNINRAPGSRVEERLYPLPAEGGAAAAAEVDAAAIAEELLALPPSEAKARAAEYIKLWGFKNTYALGKHLAEKAVAAQQARRALPLVVLRPSLVAGVAGAPYPGYVGNFAGPAGAAASYLLGLYDDQPEAAAVGGSSVWDLVPGDVVAAAVVAAAAGAAAPAGRAALRAAGAAEPAAGAAALPLMVVQAATSCTYPITASLMYNQAFLFCSAHRRSFTLARGRSRPMDPTQRLDEAAWRRHMADASRRVERVAGTLDHFGAAARRAARTARVALRCYETINSPGYDVRLRFAADNLQALEAAIMPAERAAHACVWRPPPPPPAAHAAHAAPAPAPRGVGGALLRALGGGCFGPCAAASVARAPSRASDADSETGTIAAVVAPAGAHKAAAAPGPATVAIAPAAPAAAPAGWPGFTNDGLAFMYRAFYGRTVPRSRRVPAKAWAAAEPFLAPEQRAEGPVVRHGFARVRVVRAMRP